MLKTIFSWIQQHILITIIINVLLFSGIVAAISIVYNTSTRDDTIVNDKNSSTLPIDKTLANGTYICELMFNGKSMTDDNVFKEWINKISTYDSTLNSQFSSVDFVELRDGMFDEIGSQYIVKENDVVKLFLVHNNNISEYASYNVKDNSFSINKELYRNEGTISALEMLINNVVTISQTNSSFSYNNFGSAIIFPLIYNSALNNSTDSNEVWQNIDYKKYTGLGDLVCKTSMSDKYNKYIKKYVGIASEYASESYVELFKNNEVTIKINNCGGWVTYKGKYTITHDIENDRDMLHLTSLSIWEGSTSEEQLDDLVFSFNDSGLYVINGYIGSETFDCAVGKFLVEE